MGLDAAAPPLAGLSGTSRFRFLAFDAVGAAPLGRRVCGTWICFQQRPESCSFLCSQLVKVFAVFVLAGVTIYFGRKLVRRVRSVREFRKARTAPETLKVRLEAGGKIMTTDFEKQKEAHGGERARAKRQDAYTKYATSADFCRIFYEETDRLYRLSFLLTADQEKAQHCLVSGLEDSVKGNPVLKEWARSWARRTIIQSAVRVIHPRPNEEHTASNFGRYDKMLASEPPEIVAVLLLDAFERFVYVMSVLEHYSVHDCSLLLGCAQREVVAGRVRALQQTGSAMDSHLAFAER